MQCHLSFTTRQIFFYLLLQVILYKGSYFFALQLYACLTLPTSAHKNKNLVISEDYFIYLLIFSEIIIFTYFPYPPQALNSLYVYLFSSIFLFCMSIYFKLSFTSFAHHCAASLPPTQLTLTSSPGWQGTEGWPRDHHSQRQRYSCRNPWRASRTRWWVALIVPLVWRPETESVVKVLLLAIIVGKASSEYM